MANFNDLLGKTLIEIKGREGHHAMEFYASNGDRYIMHHDKSCCERVYVEDICGDLEDLIGHPLLEASEETNRDNPKPDSDDLFLWTFYKLATIKGSVTIRWYGESNGYYSVEVDFTKSENNQ